MITLLIDFGSTYTKVTAVDEESAGLIGTAKAYTTVETDVRDGLKSALDQLTEKCGVLDIGERFACSSAAGGLKMIASGLVPELTAEAARLACLGAGARLLRSYSFELTKEDIAEIEAQKPDIFLLTGGIDGGNKECIIHNAQMLKDIPADFPILLAGNRSATAECAEILKDRRIYRCENVMPRFGELNISPVQAQIRELFLGNIIKAKGLSEASDLLQGILMPTPSAVMQAMELLCKGTKNQPGLGELIGVDLGGATTDVYSMATGAPSRDDTVVKGLPEPFAKRTVEGDIGMRYSVKGILDAVGSAFLSRISGWEEDALSARVASIGTSFIASSDADALLDHALVCGAVRTALNRHAGRLTQVFTPSGLAHVQTGKNLYDLRQMVLTGGAIIHDPNPRNIAKYVLYTLEEPESLKPLKAGVLVDRKYILSAMGLLATRNPEAALTIMKKELEDYGTVE